MRRAIVLAIAFLATQWGAREGNASESADEKIVGGSEVRDIRDMPYIVAINQIERNCTVNANGKRKCRGPERWSYACAGSLLSPLYVITACHCLADFENSTKERKAAIPMDGRADDWRYVAGSRSVAPLERTAQVRTPLELHHHPQCAREEIVAISDIGIAKMTKPFRFNEFVGPVRLFSTERRQFQADFKSMLRQAPHCQVSGWGSTAQESLDRKTNEAVISEGGQDMSYILKTAKMDVLKEQACLKRFQDWASDDFDQSLLDFKKLDQICISSPTGHEGFCSGDSGGPFVCNGYFVALVSNSMECGTTLPQICQTVLVLFDWIGYDFCDLTDCSDIVYQQHSATKIGQQSSTSAKKVHGAAKRNFVTKVSHRIVTIIVMHMLINIM